MSIKMKAVKIISTILMPLVLLFSGCATVNDPNLTADQKARKILEEDGQLIKAGVSLITQAVVQFSDENPDKRAELKDELNRVSGQVALLAQGKLNPTELIVALKVKEDYIDRILQSIVPVYSAAYHRAIEIDEVGLAADYLELIAEGIKQATQ